MINAIKSNPKSTISIASVMAILGLVFAIWKVDDRYAKAGDIDSIQQTQIEIKKSLENHLTFEKQQAINEYEDKIRRINRLENPTRDDLADKEMYLQRLKALYNNQ